ncbi:hypothetical protein PT974_00333 [Cladobotryum mycophilum]|uniref:Uncharacterized protein n=1 Tax=Cladobotryum mycophilum TaxID=491253 RepID=A0ABR0T1S2_9HYPO
MGPWEGRPEGELIRPTDTSRLQHLAIPAELTRRDLHTLTRAIVCCLQDSSIEADKDVKVRVFAYDVIEVFYRLEANYMGREDVDKYLQAAKDGTKHELVQMRDQCDLETTEQYFEDVFEPLSAFKR